MAKRGAMLPEERRILGNRIHARRKASELTQQQLADAIDVARYMVYGYEKGIHPITVEKLLLVCRATNTPATHFLDGLDRIQ